MSLVLVAQVSVAAAVLQVARDGAEDVLSSFSSSAGMLASVRQPAMTAGDHERGRDGPGLRSPGGKGRVTDELATSAIAPCGALTTAQVTPDYRCYVQKRVGDYHRRP